jgi:hypothetical protein
LCSERPRKIGAKFTGASFAPDEFMQPELKHDYEGKRDRWNGYNNEEYTVSLVIVKNSLIRILLAACGFL